MLYFTVSQSVARLEPYINWTAQHRLFLLAHSASITVVRFTHSLPGIAGVLIAEQPECVGIYLLSVY